MGGEKSHVEERWFASAAVATVATSRYSIEARETKWSAGAVFRQSLDRHSLVYRRFPSRRGLALTLRAGRTEVNGPLGQVSFIPAKCEIETHPETDGQTKAFIYRFDPEFLPWARLPVEWYMRDLRACLGVRSSHVRLLLQQLGAEALQPSFGSEALIERLAEAALIALHRAFDPLSATSRPRASSGKLSHAQMAQITNFIDSRSGPTVQAIAAELGYSVRHLSRAFRLTSGESISSHIVQARSARAIDAILSSDRPLDEIALDLGFSEASAFSNAFLKATGHRPGTYRRLFGQRRR